MTYAEKLRDPRWQKLRLKILDRDGWACRSCQSTEKSLQVHHLYYAKLDPWDYPLSCYQTLCTECHQERQWIVDEWIQNLRIFIGDVPTKDLDQVLNGAMKAVFGEWENTGPNNRVEATEGDE